MYMGAFVFGGRKMLREVKQLLWLRYFLQECFVDDVGGWLCL